MRSPKGEGVFFKRVSPGETFEFSYIHSVDKTPVTGYFLITAGKGIKPVETRFTSYGPGLPSMEIGVKAEDGQFRARPDIKEMKCLSFFVSPATQQTLIFKGERLDFSAFREGGMIKIRVKSYPLLWEVFFKYGRR